MSFYIIEPSLRDRGGHHFEFAANIAAAASATGHHVIIFAHKDCTVENVNGTRVIPWFNHHLSEDIKCVVGYGLSNFLYFNESIYRDLRRLNSAFSPRPVDTILFPTVSENQLSGIVRWAQKFRTSEAPSFIIYLMFSPDFWLSDFEQSSRVPLSGERSLFYKMALKNALGIGRSLKLFAGGRQIAREFSALVQSRIESHPLPLSLGHIGRRVANLERPTTLLYAGLGKQNKGFLLLADLADRLSKGNPGHTFIIHVDFRRTANTPPDMCLAFEQLKDISQLRDNVVLCTGVLNREQYLALITRADIFVCTYDPITYARQTSGVAWEAISLGLPILAPANTFIQREAAEWGAGFSTYTTWSAAGISKAYTSFTKQIGALTDASQLASERFYAANSAAALADHLARLEKTSPTFYSFDPAKHLRNSRLYLVAAWLRFRVGQKLGRKSP